MTIFGKVHEANMKENVISIDAVKEAPNIVNWKVATPIRKTNIESRPREYLKESEIELLMKAAKKVGRHGHRDSTLILIAYRHAFRVSELTTLRWDAIDLKQGLIHVNRLKGGVASTHPISGVEIRDLRRLKREYDQSPFVFTTERKGPITSSTVRKMITRSGINAGIDFPIHPHMLRHSTGFKLANDGQDTRSIQHYMGHRNIQHTVRYTELAPDRFRGGWNDRFFITASALFT
jgi:type 1 fimbriae regulatory protein FimE